MTRYCGECNYTDGVVYTSLPPQVKCTITNKYHLCDHVCEVYNDTFVNKKLSKKDFIMTYCNNCGSQRCEGIDSDWLDGCKYKNRLKMEDGK